MLSPQFDDDPLNPADPRRRQQLFAGDTPQLLQPDAAIAPAQAPVAAAPAMPDRLPVGDDDPLVQATRPLGMAVSAARLTPNFGDLPTKTRQIDAPDEVARRLMPSPDLEQPGAELGHATAPIVTTPARDLARYEVGEEPKRGKWGKLLDVGVGALAGAMGRELPAHMTPFGRHQLYEREVDRREAEIRQQRADEQDLEDRGRAREEFGLRRDLLRSQITENNAQAHKLLNPQFSRRPYQIKGNYVVFDDDPLHPVAVEGADLTEDGWQLKETDRGLVWGNPRTQEVRPATLGNRQLNPYQKPEKPVRPTAFDVNTELDSEVRKYVGGEKGQSELTTLKKQLLWRNLHAIDPQLDPEELPAEIARLQQTVNAAGVDDGPVMATGKNGTQYADEDATRARDNAKRAAASSAQQRLNALKEASDKAEAEAPKLHESRVRDVLGPQVRARMNTDGQGAAAAPDMSVADALKLIDAAEQRGDITPQDAASRRAAVRAAGGR